MRLTCDVDVANRLLPSFNMRGKGKSSRSQLSVGRKLVATGSKETSDVYLMICTKLDRNGAKYKLEGNIETFFTKFISQGKATVRFKEPPHDVCLSKADPVQLKGLLSVLRMGCQGKGLEKVTLSSLAPPSAKQVEKLKTKMSITTKRDYPITTNFPSSLESLSVQHCTLKRVDSRMLQLKNLTKLDLSHNSIKALPEDFSKTPQLAELILTGNQIEEVPAGLCKGPLSKSLSILDLSNNKIRILKPHFCKLEALYTLRLENNQLVFLPSAFNRFVQLKNLTVSSNQLKTLPGGMMQLHLDTLDLGQNPFMDDGPSTPINRLHVPTLLEWSARFIRQHRLPVTEEDLGPLYSYITSGRRCMCGRYCFQSHVHYLTRVDLRKISTNVTALDAQGRTHAPCEAFLCSQTCFERYKKNPFATIWK